MLLGPISWIKIGWGKILKRWLRSGHFLRIQPKLVGKVHFLNILPKIIREHIIFEKSCQKWGGKIIWKKKFCRNFFLSRNFLSPNDFSHWFLVGFLKNQVFPKFCIKKEKWERHSLQLNNLWQNKENARYSQSTVWVARVVKDIIFVRFIKFVWAVKVSRADRATSHQSRQSSVFRVVWVARVIRVLLLHLAGSKNFV